MINIFKDEDGWWRVGWVALSAIFLAVSGLAGVTVIVRQIDYHYTSTYCLPKLNQIHRRGKFVEYNFWEYDCLVRSSNGTYISIDHLYNNIQENSVNTQ